MKRTILAIICALLLAACSKDNKQAKELDGIWKLDKWSWEGKDTLPAGTYPGEKGTWTFVACKAAKNNCGGTVNDFGGSNKDEAISWYIREKGSTFTMAPDNSGTALGNLGGAWEIVELSENKFIISSQTCGSCNSLGKSRLEFSR